MFFDIFKKLCENRGISVKRAAEDIGLSNSIAILYPYNPTLWICRKPAYNAGLRLFCFTDIMFCITSAREKVRYKVRHLITLQKSV